MPLRLNHYTLEFATSNHDVTVADSRANAYCIDGRFAYPPHDHTEHFDLIYIDKGVRHETVNGAACPLEPGDLILIRRGDWHEGHGESLRYFMLCGTNAWLESVLNFMQFTEVYQALCKLPEPPHVNIPIQKRKALNQEWERCWEVQFSRLGPGYILALTTKLFIHYLLPQVEQTIQQRLFPEWFRDGINYIHSRVGKPISSEDLANACKKSPEHISRSFQSFLGVSPSQYINLTRLNYAGRLLNTTTLPILEISMKAGFNNLGYFYTLFKKRFNMSPRDYRLHYQAVQTPESSPEKSRRLKR